MNKTIAASLLILLCSVAVFSNQQQNEKTKQLQSKAQKAINEAIKSCSIDSGSNYSARPMIIKMKNHDSSVTMESEVELEGIILKATNGAYTFSGYNHMDVTINGKLKFTYNYINGSTANFTGKYSGNIKWKITGDSSFETEAVYDYETVSENSKIKYSGTVTSGGKKFRFNQDGSVSEAD